ncbi:hypothetical protein BSNK01_14270 [Bacillaceae bacterium]
MSIGNVNQNPSFFPSASQVECHSRPAEPRVLVTSAVVKVPVVLAELTVQVNMDATITFPEPVLEIKDIKKRVKLTQCRLFVLPGINGDDDFSGKLFLKGFVRQNIQYATPTTVDEKAVTSELHSLTIDVPFQCVTVITEFDTPPQPFLPSGRQDFEFSSTPLPLGFPVTERRLSADFTQFEHESYENFNELPFCELISSRISEFDEISPRTACVPDPSFPFEEGTFTQIEEKMVLDMTLKLLQHQQVRIG